MEASDVLCDVLIRQSTSSQLWPRLRTGSAQKKSALCRLKLSFLPGLTKALQ